MPWSKGMWNNNIMAKKQFNFAQMAGAPVVEDANETMVKAFEQNNEQPAVEQAPTPQAEQQSADQQTQNTQPIAKDPQTENPKEDNAQEASVAIHGAPQGHMQQYQEQPLQQAPIPVVTAPIHRTMLTQQLRTEQVMKMDELLRDEWMQYLAVYAGSITIGANVQIPEGIDDRLEAIKKRMRGVPGAVKMQKKNLILLALWEFVEKYDR